MAKPRKSHEDLPEQEIVAEYQRGGTLRGIGEKYGVSSPTIRRLLLRNNVAIRTTGRRKLSPGQVAEIKQKYSDGATQRTLADEYGVSTMAISWALDDTEPHPQGGRHRTDLPDQEIIDRYRAGDTIVALAEAYDTTTSTIAHRLKRAGVKTRTAPQAGKLPADEVIAAYTKHGETIRSLAEKYGVSRDTVRVFLIKHGVQMRPTGTPRQKDA